ncbi:MULTISPECIES: hypothetical protein [unclassified Lysobacter]|uniref:hypothetical protein n=1 Tax=unclassified Lysobacter TaxID=2635362 RepID=UPI001BE77BBF|nr:MULTISPECIES: hypothetical protein [unclassified Lysobacter]MBT2747081.1 hypothetical protein [Lysobacter sp. ISL-42]MBT2750458.1 hypothetical protein [Lysobacter sp. ISL-50]MBT2776304.1 hypothetical protein [Lysobacter sp. ISL-54]MBT2780799.1 hypothetical protein [Lysobacter sp. ISL-52]
MKRLLLAAALSLSAFAAFAQTAAVDARVQASANATALDSADAQAQARVQADSKSVAATKNRYDPNCVSQTGTRLQPRHRSNCIANGRSYTREDLDRTGQVDVGEALRKLDPRLY